MSQFSQRLKDRKRAIHPVIATIVLIAVTLVLALVVGAYTFGLFGSNVKAITLTSATLYTRGSFEFGLNNPGAGTTISSIVMTSGNGQQVTLTNSAVTVGGTVTSQISGGAASSVAVPIPGTYSLTSCHNYSYVISFQYGMSICGSVIAV